MTHKFRMLSERANTVLATLERNEANAKGDLPAVGWFSWTSLKPLALKGYVKIKSANWDNGYRPSNDRAVTLTDLGREYRAWSKSQ